MEVVVLLGKGRTPQSRSIYHSFIRNLYNHNPVEDKGHLYVEVLSVSNPCTNHFKNTVGYLSYSSDLELYVCFVDT